MVRIRLIANPEDANHSVSWSAVGIMMLNFIYLVFGVGIITFGVLLISNDFDGYFKMIDIGVRLSSLLIYVGFLLLATFVFGFIGVCRGDKYCLSAFALILTLMFVFQIGILLGGQQVRNKTNMTIIIDMNKTLSNYNFNDQPTNSNQIWDNMQQSFKCCGVINASDWQHIVNHKAPESCCKKMTKGCSSDLQNVYQNGCFGEIKKFLNEKVDSVNIVLMILAVMQLIGLASSCFLIGNMGRGYEILL